MGWLPLPSSATAHRVTVCWWTLELLCQSGTTQTTWLSCGDCILDTAPFTPKGVCFSEDNQRKICQAVTRDLSLSNILSWCQHFTLHRSHWSDLLHQGLAQLHHLKLWVASTNLRRGLRRESTAQILKQMGWWDTDGFCKGSWGI